MPKAIVSGGGIAGLSAAIALSTQGWTVEVYERGGGIREIGAGIFLKGNGLRVVESYGILDRIARDCVVLKEAHVMDPHGNMLQRRILKEVNRVWDIKRELLIQALHDRAVELGTKINVNAEVTDYSEDGYITVGGERIGGDLVVAADGIGSVARRKFGLGRPARQPLSGAIRILLPRTELESRNITREFWSKRYRVGVAPCTATEVYSYLAGPLSDPNASVLPVDEAFWSERFPKLASDGFFARAAKVDAVHHPYPYVSVRNWFRGKVALVGDAVHGLPPTLGQGAGLSLMNTMLLSKYASDTANVPQALEAWERDWRWVSNQTQAWALHYDRMTSEWPPIAYPLRSAIIWGIGKSRKINDHMRIADRIDAPNRRVLNSADFRPSAAAR